MSVLVKCSGMHFAMNLLVAPILKTAKQKRLLGIFSGWCDNAVDVVWCDNAVDLINATEEEAIELWDVTEGNVWLLYMDWQEWLQSWLPLTDRIRVWVWDFCHF